MHQTGLPTLNTGPLLSKKRKTWQQLIKLYDPHDPDEALLTLQNLLILFFFFFFSLLFGLLPFRCPTSSAAEQQQDRAGMVISRTSVRAQNDTWTDRIRLLHAVWMVNPDQRWEQMPICLNSWLCLMQKSAIFKLDTLFICYTVHFITVYHFFYILFYTSVQMLYFAYFFLTFLYLVFIFNLPGSKRYDNKVSLNPWKEKPL